MDTYVKGKHGTDSPYSNVEYHAGYYYDERRGKFVDATYLVPGLGGLELEEMAMMLAERVERNHPGQGRMAFESAKIQLLTRDFNGEWNELQRKIRVHKMWGGPVPAAVLVPDEIDPRQWRAIVPDKNGVPFAYNVREKDIMPPPEEGVNARKGRQGWETKPAPQAVQRERINRARVKAVNR
jgi:hypothetical protein